MWVFTLLRWLPQVIKLWPYVEEAVRTVEAMRRTESGEVKKVLAKRYLQEKLPNFAAKYGMSEKDWDNLVGGLIDVVVAILNWRNAW